MTTLGLCFWGTSRYALWWFHITLFHLSSFWGSLSQPCFSLDSPLPFSLRIPSCYSELFSLSYFQRQIHFGSLVRALVYLLTDLGLPRHIRSLSFPTSTLFPKMWRGTSWKIWSLENSNEHSRKGKNEKKKVWTLKSAGPSLMPSVLFARCVISFPGPQLSYPQESGDHNM